MSEARRWPVISALGVVQILTWGSSFYLPVSLAGWLLALGMGCGLYDPSFATLGRHYGAEARRSITEQQSMSLNFLCHTL